MSLYPLANSEAATISCSIDSPTYMLTRSGRLNVVLTPVNPPVACNWPLKVSEWVSIIIIRFAGIPSLMDFFKKDEWGS